MRFAWFLVAAACAGAPPEAVAPAAGPSAAKRTQVDDAPPVDPIAALAPADDGPVSWLVPGRIQLELGGIAIEGPGGNRPIEVGLIEQHGGLIRVAVRLDHARFSAWSDRARLLAVLLRDTRMAPLAGMPSEIQVVLRAGARVRRLARRNGTTQIRFVGAVEVEGWVPDDALGDAAARRDPLGRIPSGRRTLMVTPGAVIRSEPRWAAPELATMANGYFLDSIKEIDEAWVEVAYADGEVAVHGFVSRRAPPGRVHRTRDPEVAPQPVIANAKVASGTCLYARPSGDMVGYIVGDRDVELDDLNTGWWTLALDTPWGPVTFAARGPNQHGLVPCAPPGSVPPPIGTAVSPP